MTMPRVHKRTAAKDYPKSGIKKGDVYYYTKLKLQRGGIEKRSLKPFKPSELTTSPFKSGFLAVGERWDESGKGVDDIRAAADAIRDLGGDVRASFDNMPEGLQQGDTGQMLETRADGCDEKADELDGLADELDDLEDPEVGWEEPEEPIEPDEGEGEEYEALKVSWEELCDERATVIAEHEEAVSEYESEIERITGEAGDLINEMPE
jgi:PAS domain-containing protein